eukprot:gb/GECH01011916.1/.p1 GENE.gb/GECH01011916.1/~~gb/GECH01011916.1/.p1  ORF type:complete len:193 (+),score=41.26 gb/GECH01011916.1/:1-579(+)
MASFGSKIAASSVFAGAYAAFNYMNLNKVSAAPSVAGEAGSTSERTFVAVKPDGVQRHLLPVVIDRFQRKGYQLVGLKMMQPSQQLAEKHYDDLQDKPFYPGLVKYMSSSGPVVAMIWQGKDVIRTGRTLIGATHPLQSSPGTIRGDFALDIGRNVIHGSDSHPSAEKEIDLWFRRDEICSWKPAADSWVYE